PGPTPRRREEALVPQNIPDDCDIHQWQSLVFVLQFFAIILMVYLHVVPFFLLTRTIVIYNISGLYNRSVSNKS
ncbi:hypothetical protein ACJX0J_037807, partial [Zea mays]